METLGKYCKEKGVTLTLLIEKSGVQKGTLESRWKLGKKKEIDCLINGATDTVFPNGMHLLRADRDRLLKLCNELTKEKYGVE